MKIVEIDGKNYNLKFSLRGLKEAQKLISIRQSKKDKEGYSEIDDVVEFIYCFLKASNRSKTDETQTFTMALSKFWDIIDDDIELFGELSDSFTELMDSYNSPEDKKK